jgi:hypothetical protein
MKTVILVIVAFITVTASPAVAFQTKAPTGGSKCTKMLGAPLRGDKSNVSTAGSTNDGSAARQ